MTLRVSAAGFAAAVACAWIAALLGGCTDPSPDHGATGLAYSLADSEFLPAVGTDANAPRVDAFYAPGAQSACAWLPDGTFWNGDFGLAVLPGGMKMEAVYASPQPAGPHRALPAARRRWLGDLAEFRAFMPWRGSDADTTAWTRLSVRVTEPPNPPGQPIPKGPRIVFLVQSGGPLGHPLDPRAVIGDRFTYTFKDGRILRDGRTIILIEPTPGTAARRPRATSDPQTGKPIDAQQLCRAAEVDISGSKPLAWDVWIAPVGGAAANARPPDHGESFERSLTRTAAAWQAEMDQGAAIEHPDPRVQAALLSARRLLVGNRERRDGSLHFLGNPLQYRDLFLRDGVRVARALALLGRPELAADALASLYRFQWPGGAFLSQRGQLDGTGQALWGLRQLAELGGDRAFIEAKLEPALRGARWIALQRAQSQRRGGPAAGLLPYADPRDNELVRGHLSGNDAWGIAGLEALAATMRDFGRASVADSLFAEARAYRATLLATWAREERRQGRPLPPVIEGGGREWGNLAAAWPCRVFAADDPRFRALDRWFRARFYVAGLPTYGSRDSLHHYVGIDLARAALERGDRATAAADLAALLDHAQPDGSGFELAARGGGFGDNLPPHGTFAALFVDLARAGLLRERGDSLVLFSGLAEGSLTPASGARVRLARAPTRFGTADVALAAASGGTATMQLDVALPAPAVVEWPPPTRIRAIGRAGGAGGETAVLGADGRSFVLPAGHSTWRIEFAADVAPGGAR